MRDQTARAMFWWAMLGIFLIFLMSVIMLCIPPNASAQIDGFQVQFTHGGESDLAGFHLKWGTASGSYGVSYNLTMSQYKAPPEWIGVPIPLVPGSYYFVVTAYDESGNESDNSDESGPFVVEDVKPGACSAPVIRRIPIP